MEKNGFGEPSSPESDGVNQRNSLNRRTVLRSAIGSATFGVVGGSQSVGASSDTTVGSKNRQQVFDRYEQPADVRRAIASTAKGLLEELSQQDLLERGDADALSLSEVLHPREYTLRDEGVTTLAVGHDPEEGTYTPEILVRRRTEKGRLFIKVLPETGEAFAMLDEEPVVARRTRGSGFEVGPFSCGPLACPDPCITGTGCYVAGTCGCATRDLYCCQNGDCMWGDFERTWVNCDQYDCDGYCDCACGFDDYPACDECG